MVILPPLAAIDFASPAMLGWLGAAALPWLINLWSRRRHVETSWAAVQLLLQAVRERSRRLRLRELVLLAVRTSIFLLVGLAAARPLWRDAAAAGRLTSRTHHVIAIDRSFSMATQSDGESHFERATEAARRIIESAAAGDAITVIAWSDAADNVLGQPTFESGDALTAIDSLEPSDAVADLTNALRVAEKAIEAARKEFPGLDRTHLTLVSDATATTWAPALPPPESTRSAAASPSAAVEAWRRLSQAASLSVENVDDGVRDNLAIVDVQLETSAAVNGQPLVILARLEAFGERTWNDLPIDLLVDGEQAGSQLIDVAAGQSTVTRFEVRGVDRGYHAFEIRLPEDADALSIDNRRWLAAELRGPPKVMCFTDGPRAASDIARALNPRRGGAGDVAVGGIAVEVAAATSLTRVDLSTCDAVFLTNVAELTEREKTLLRQYVADGGALAIVLGSRIRAETYNQFFNESDGRPALPAGPLLPVRLAASPAEGDWRIDPLDYRHAVLAPFAGHMRPGLLGVRVSRYVPLALEQGESPAAVAMRFTSGDPALVVGDYGLGRVAVLATDPALVAEGQPWSSLAISPSFLPLMRELLAHLTANRRAELLNRLVGESLLLPPRLSAKGRQWKTPSGQVTAVQPDTRRRGVYAFLGDLSASDSAGAGTPIAFAVNVDPRESDLATIDLSQLPSQAGANGHPAAPDGGGAVDYGAVTELAPWLLAAAAGLVLLELLVAWSFGRGWA